MSVHFNLQVLKCVFNAAILIIKLNVKFTFFCK